MSKKLLFKFLKKFYNPDLMYIDTEIDGYLIKVVQFIIDILINGFIAYLFLLGLILIFGVTGIFLGSEYWHFVYIIPLLGIMLGFTAHWYKYFRYKYKGGKK